MTLYLARLCWNEHGWTRPSGVARNAEGPAVGSGGTFASKYGYGHEEWLFQPEHTIDGWRYGFLQPAVRASDAPRDVLLYTIDPSRGRWYLGRINGVEILDEPAAEVALRQFEQRGWLRAMRENLFALGLNLANDRPASAPRDFLNVRYKVDHAWMLPQAVKATRPDPTTKPGMNHYRFYPLAELPKYLRGTHADADQPPGHNRCLTAPIVSAV